MCRGTMEISKEVYEKSVENNNKIPGNLEIEVFGEALVCGYGIYGTRTYEKDGKYFVDYDRGSTCD